MISNYFHTFYDFLIYWSWLNDENTLWDRLWRNWHNVIVFGLHIELHIQLCESMTKSYCWSWMLCDMWWNLWWNRHNVIVFGLISGFISNNVNLWRNLTVCHECNAIYDEIKKCHVNFVIDQRISCSENRKERKEEKEKRKKPITPSRPASTGPDYLLSLAHQPRWPAGGPSRPSRLRGRKASRCGERPGRCDQ
jgi:hypothetical protein